MHLSQEKKRSNIGRDGSAIFRGHMKGRHTGAADDHDSDESSTRGKADRKKQRQNEIMRAMEFNRQKQAWMFKLSLKMLIKFRLCSVGNNTLVLIELEDQHSLAHCMFDGNIHRFDLAGH